MDTYFRDFGQFNDISKWILEGTVWPCALRSWSREVVRPISHHVHNINQWLLSISYPSIPVWFVYTESEALFEAHPRLRALEVAQYVIQDPVFAKAMSSLAPGPDPVVMLMFNKDHLELARNALFCIGRVGLLARTLVMGIGAEVCSVLAKEPSSRRPLCYSLPDVTSFCPHCGR